MTYSGLLQANFNHYINTYLFTYFFFSLWFVPTQWVVPYGVGVYFNTSMENICVKNYNDPDWPKTILHKMVGSKA